MSNYSAVRGPRPADPRPLRVAALTAVVAGVVLLAAAAFVLSYAGIHQIALRAGISPQLARLYPVTFDAMLVIAAAAALALRGAGWWPRAYAWFSLLLMLAAVAVGDALHAAHVVLPIQPTRVVVAVTPWVLLLLAFGLLLEMLRHFRRVRSGNGQAPEAGRPAPAAAVMAAQAVNGNGDSGTAGPRAAVTWATAGVGGDGQDLPRPRSGLDLLLGPREGEPPAMPGTRPDGAMTDEYSGAGYYPDPVAYGEETGYVHPDSYRDHGGFPGAAYPGDHEGYAGPGDPDQPEHGDESEPGPSGDAAAGQAGKHQAEPRQTEQHQADGPQPTANSGEGNPPAANAAAANTVAANAAPASQATVNPVEAKPDEAKPDEAKRAAAHPAQAGSANASSAAASPAGSPAEQGPGGGTAQTGPAGTHDSPAHNGDAPAQPATPPANPRLERLRSTPAPPED